ncbi:AIM24 family protein [Nostoc sp. CENA67]|uniref:AIM24 family protein n=1 Tax=Amazonocrinis nigriterrae CENA67 TaxID=2794033 RepID=A0A8J7L7M9_9NOST|nr:AIM24 family protein [Amazonocrinis nigriterrae]MBH8563584.1 AIM24 family protein [Amazonocrinis nigriterrae CENA67]
MQHQVKILEPTDLWYLENNINKETNRYYHPTKDIPFVQQVEIKLENSGVVIQKGSMYSCVGKLTYGVYKTDNRLKDIWISLRTDIDYNAPVYRGTGTVKLEPRQKGDFLHYTNIEILEHEQWEFDDGVFQFCSDNVVIGTKRLKFRQIAGSDDGRWRIALSALPGQKAQVVTATFAPTKIIELNKGEVLIADYDMVKGFTKGIEEDYRKLGHFGKGGGEGYVWFYNGEGKLLVSETSGMALG